MPTIIETPYDVGTPHLLPDVPSPDVGTPYPLPDVPPGDFMRGIKGTPYSDTLIGTAAKDEIYGLGGNDWLYGRGGKDYLFGGSGNDYLDGEAGRDRLSGGSGADKYVFSSLSDSPDTGPGVNGDTIIGFNRDEGDKIDLSKIDADWNYRVFPAVVDNDDTLGNVHDGRPLSYSDGVLRADVIGGPDVEIALAGAPSLNIFTDVIFIFS